MSAGSSLGKQASTSFLSLDPNAVPNNPITKCSLRRLVGPAIGSAIRLVVRISEAR
jgi:hypothetical protein